jgi:NADH-ubiquinone oxidoreductase chain 2
VAIALPSFKRNISSLLITRISAIIFIYSGALALNAFYIQSIGSGLGIYSGLFHVTIISQLLDVLLLFLSALILMS